MELEDVWEPGIGFVPVSFGQGDKQQLLWGYPDILWGAPVVVVAAARALGGWLPQAQKKKKRKPVEAPWEREQPVSLRETLNNLAEIDDEEEILSLMRWN